MSNRRFMLFFIVGTILLGGLLIWTEAKSRWTAPVGRKAALCELPPHDVTSCELRMGGRSVVHLVRKSDGAWHIVSPFSIQADSSAVLRLIDMMTLVPVEDMRSEGELIEMDETLEDFGITLSSFTVVLGTGAESVTVCFGRNSPSNKEVFAYVEESRRVCVMPIKSYALIPRGLDDFRIKSLLTSSCDEIGGLDIRVPDKPAVRLSRDGGAWSILSPVAAPADESAVNALVDRIASAQVEAFEMPSAAHPLVPSGGFRADDLVQYGLDAGLSVTVRGAAGRSEQIVFGGSAGTNLVWALVRNATSIVKVDANLSERCRAGGESLRDTRIFPLAEGETITSVSFTAGPAVYVLAQDTNKAWRIESPVMAPADQAKTADFMERLLRLRQNDMSSDKGGEDGRVLVSLSTSVTNRPGLAVSASLLGGRAAFADLRSKTMLTLDPSSVRRISLRTASGAETSVRWNAGRSAWDLERREDAADARRVNEATVKGLLSALTRVEASGVETLAATADDMRRCGLDKPAFILAVDMNETDSLRKNVLLGNNAPGGGRFATVGGADAVFVLSRRTVSDLTPQLAE